MIIEKIADMKHDEEIGSNGWKNHKNKFKFVLKLYLSCIIRSVARLI